MRKTGSSLSHRAALVAYLGVFSFFGCALGGEPNGKESAAHESAGSSPPNLSSSPYVHLRDENEPTRERLDIKPREVINQPSVDSQHLSCHVKNSITYPEFCPLDRLEFLVASQAIFDPSLSGDEQSSLAFAFTPVLYGVVKKHDGTLNNQGTLTFASTMRLTTRGHTLGEVKADEGHRVYIPISTSPQLSGSPLQFSKRATGGVLSMPIELQPIVTSQAENSAKHESTPTHSLTLAVGFLKSSHRTAIEELKSRIAIQISQLGRKLEVAQEIADKCGSSHSCFFSEQRNWLVEIENSADILRALVTAVVSGQLANLATMPPLNDKASEYIADMTEAARYHLYSVQLLQDQEELLQSYRDLHVLNAVEPFCRLDEPRDEGDAP